MRNKTHFVKKNARIFTKKPKLSAITFPLYPLHVEILETADLAEELILALLVPVDGILIERHQRHQFVVTRNDDGLVHVIDVVDDLLDLLRIDVLKQTRKCWK